MIWWKDFLLSGCHRQAGDGRSGRLRLWYALGHLTWVNIDPVDALWLAASNSARWNWQDIFMLLILVCDDVWESSTVTYNVNHSIGRTVHGFGWWRRRVKTPRVHGGKGGLISEAMKILGQVTDIKILRSIPSVTFVPSLLQFFS